MSWHDTPQQAIEDYLDALLHDDLQEDDTPQERIAETAPWQEESLQARQLSDTLNRARQQKTELARPALQLEQVDAVPQVILPELQVAAPVQAEAPKIPESEPAPVVPQPVEPPAPVVESPRIVEQDQVPAQPPSPPGWKNGRPVWAQDRFECLLFKVKGLTLAVPLVELGGIIKIEREPTPLFGQPSWFIGMLRANNANICMIDTAQWVLPPALIEKDPEPYKLIIRIHDSVWGLSCNEVDRSISLQPDQVRWRTSLGRRPWLAGTVIDHMCALIDVAAFDRLLREGHGELEPANLSALKGVED